MGDLTSVGEIGKELDQEAPFPLTDTDKWVLSQNDEDFHLHTWDELKEIIGKASSNYLLLLFNSSHLWLTPRACCPARDLHISLPLPRISPQSLEKANRSKLPINSRCSNASPLISVVTWHGHMKSKLNTDPWPTISFNIVFPGAQPLSPTSRLFHSTMPQTTRFSLMTGRMVLPQISRILWCGPKPQFLRTRGRAM